MYSKIVLFLILFIGNFYTQFGQAQTARFINYIPIRFEISEIVSGKFDNDTLTDFLLILNNKIESESFLLDVRDSLTKRKVIILLGLNGTEKYKKIYENDDLVPCRECGGKSDNLYSFLSINRGIFTYKTCEAPFAQESYQINQYKLKFIENNFKLINYKEIYYNKPDDDTPILINVNERELAGNHIYPFNYYEWDWKLANNILIDKNNVKKFNNIAYKYSLYKRYDISLTIINKVIEKFPTQVVAYLNRADCHWELKEKEKAKRDYKKYVQLMKEQNKDLTRIPDYVYERLKE